MFEVKVINYFGNEEHWSWDSLEQLQHDCDNADILALPNDFDKVIEAYSHGLRLNVDTFGDFIQYIKDTCN